MTMRLQSSSRIEAGSAIGVVGVSIAVSLGGSHGMGALDSSGSTSNTMLGVSGGASPSRTRIPKRRGLRLAFGVGRGFGLWVFFFEDMVGSFCGGFAHHAGHMEPAMSAEMKARFRTIPILFVRN